MNHHKESEPYNTLVDVANVHKKSAELISKTEEIAVVFIDLVGSTELKGKREQVEWLPIIAEFLATVSDCVEKHQGAVVKFIGDEVMATFENDSKESSVDKIEIFVRDCEQSLKRSKNVLIAKYAADAGNAARINMPGGRVDYLGECVDRCARVARLTKGHCLLVGPGLVKEVIFGWKEIGVFDFKGIKYPSRVFQLEKIGEPIIVNDAGLAVLSAEHLIGLMQTKSIDYENRISILIETINQARQKNIDLSEQIIKMRNLYGR